MLLAYSVVCIGGCLVAHLHNVAQLIVNVTELCWRYAVPNSVLDYCMCSGQLAGEALHPRESSP